MAYTTNTSLQDSPRPQDFIYFCGGLLQTQDNYTVKPGLLEKECFIDALRCLPHLIVTLLMVPLLLALRKAQPASYHTRTWVHFPWHKSRWLLLMLGKSILVLAIGEGFLSDSLHPGTHMSFIVPYILALSGIIMTMAYYHDVELCNSPKFLVLLLLYWLANVTTEVLKLLFLLRKNLAEIYVRVYVTWALVVLYGCLFFLELDLLRRLKYIFLRKPVLLVPPEDLVPLRYIQDRVSFPSRLTFFWLKRLNIRAFRGYIDWRDLEEIPKAHESAQVARKYLKNVDLQQLFQIGVTYQAIYKHVLCSPFTDVFLIISCCVVSQLLVCAMPILLYYVILYMDEETLISDISTNTSNKSSEMAEQQEDRYANVASYWSNGYILVILGKYSLMLASILKETSKHAISRNAEKLNSIIRVLVVKKLLRVRAQYLVNTDVALMLSSLNFGDIINGPILLVEIVVKVVSCLFILTFSLSFYGLLSSLGLLVFPVATLSVSRHICTAESSRTDSAENIFRNIKMRHFYSLLVELIPVILAVVIFLSYGFAGGQAPHGAPIVCSLISMYILKKSLQDFLGVLDCYQRWMSVRNTLEILKLPEVLGRSQAVEAGADRPDIPSVVIVSRSPSPCPPEVRVVDTQPLTITASESGSRPAVIELAELAPMLGTIREEESDIDGSISSVVFTAGSEDESPCASENHSNTPLGSQANEQIQASFSALPSGRTYVRQQSSGAMSHTSEDSLLFSPRRGVGLEVEVSEGGCEVPQTLSEINMKIPSGKLTVITGDAGAGKAFLLRGILLGNTENFSGNACWKTNTQVSYSGHPGWIMAGSIIENITFGQVLNSNRYKKIIRMCLLQKHIDSYPSKDSTLIGGDVKTFNMTEEECNRIALARAIYAKSDAVVMNEPLIHTDINVGSQIFEDAILNYLLKRKRTVILATRQIQFLPFAHMIYNVHEGRITHSGTLQEIKDADIGLFNKWQEAAKIVRNESYAKMQASMIIKRPSSLSKEIPDPGSDGYCTLAANENTSQRTSPNKPSPRKPSQHSITSSSHQAADEPNQGSVEPEGRLYSTQTSRELHDDLLEPYEKGPHILSNHTQHGRFRKHSSRNRYEHIFSHLRTLWHTLCLQSWILWTQLVLVVAVASFTTVTYIYMFRWSVKSHLLNNATDVEQTGSIHQPWQYTWAITGGIALVLTLALYCSLYCGTVLALSKLEAEWSEPNVNEYRSQVSDLVTRGLTEADKFDYKKRVVTLLESFRLWLQCVCIIAVAIVSLVLCSPYTVIPITFVIVVQVVVMFSHSCSHSQLSQIQVATERAHKLSMREMIEGLTYIRAFKKEDYYLSKVYDKLDALTNVSMWMSVLHNWLHIRLNVLTSLLFMATVMCLISDPNDGELKKAFVMTGTVYALLVYFVQDDYVTSLLRVKEQLDIIGVYREMLRDGRKSEVWTP